MYTFYNSAFPAKLKALRIQSGKSQEVLAKELGISRSCLANYETGNRQPDQEMLIRIADIFEVLTDYLIDRDKFRDFNLTLPEMNDFTRIKNAVDEHLNYLDLSFLNSEGRIGMIQFYDFLKRKIQILELNKSTHDCN